MKIRFLTFIPRGIMVAALVCFFLASPALAQTETGKSSLQGDARGRGAGEQPIPTKAGKTPPQPSPERFDGGGRIDIIYQDSMVINDKEKNLAPGVTYHNDSGDRIETTRFEVGTVVKFKVNRKGDITQIWLDKKPEAGEE